MQARQWRVERERLLTLLDGYESGRITHLEEDGTGMLRRDVSAERIAAVKERIANLDRKLVEGSDA